MEIAIVAKYLKVGNIFKDGKSLQEIKAIERLTDKAITLRTKRISPDPYDGNFFKRFNINTRVIVTNL